MERRDLLLTAGGIAGAVGIAGCLEDDSVEEGSTRQSRSDDSSSSADDSESGSDDPTLDFDDSDQEETEEECETVTETADEVVVENSRSVDGGYEWTHEYRIEDGDDVHFDISASDGQDIEVEIDSPRGRTIYEDSGVSVSSTHQFDSGGSGEVRTTNLVERTEEEREELWEDREDVSAGANLSSWVELEEGDSVDYFVRQVSGARPNLTIEDAHGNELREHSVSDAIDDEYTVPEDGRYYFVMENTAFINSGTWDYEFERVVDVPIPTTVTLEIEREYEEEIEVCE